MTSNTFGWASASLALVSLAAVAHAQDVCYPQVTSATITECVPNTGKPQPTPCGAACPNPLVSGGVKPGGPITVAVPMPACHECGCATCVHANVYTTSFAAFCPEGITTQVYVVKELYTGMPAPPSITGRPDVPLGFVRGEQSCHSCGPEPITTKLTYPADGCPFVGGQSGPAPAPGGYLPWVVAPGNGGTGYAPAEGGKGWVPAPPPPPKPEGYGPPPGYGPPGYGPPGQGPPGQGPPAGPYGGQAGAQAGPQAGAIAGAAAGAQAGAAAGPGWSAAQAGAQAGAAAGAAAGPGYNGAQAPPAPGAGPAPAPGSNVAQGPAPPGVGGASPVGASPAGPAPVGPAGSPDKGQGPAPDKPAAPPAPGAGGSGYQQVSAALVPTIMSTLAIGFGFFSVAILAL